MVHILKKFIAGSILLGGIALGSLNFRSDPAITNLENLVNSSNEVRGPTPEQINNGLDNEKSKIQNKREEYKASKNDGLLDITDKVEILSKETFLDVETARRIYLAGKSDAEICNLYPSIRSVSGIDNTLNLKAETQEKLIYGLAEHRRRFFKERGYNQEVIRDLAKYNASELAKLLGEYLVSERQWVLDWFSKAENGEVNNYQRKRIEVLYPQDKQRVDQMSEREARRIIQSVQEGNFSFPM